MNRLLKLVRWGISRVIVLCLLTAMVFSGYSLWSNHRVYGQAEDVYNQLLLLKPVLDEEGEKLDFSQLKAINSDVCGWLTLPGTKIDYPILRGENNLVYMNRDVFGSFSLAGSIFMDTRNSPRFMDSYTLVYGHHMSESLMFGDLDLYKDETFFETNHSAMVVTEDSIMEMKVLAVLEVPASAQEIFDPMLWGKDLTGLARYVEQNGMYVWDVALEELKKNPTTTQAVALATCSNGATGNRTVVILIARRPEGHGDNPSNGGGQGATPSRPNPLPPKTGDSLYNAPALWTAALWVSLAVALLTGWRLLRRKD